MSPPQRRRSARILRGPAGAVRGIAAGLGWLVTGGLGAGLRPVAGRSLLARPVRSLLTVAAVTLGVAVMLGVQIDIAGAQTQAREAAAARTGSSGLDVQTTAGGGLSSDQLAALSGVPGVEQVAPLYEKEVSARAAQAGSPVTTVILVGISGGQAALRPIALVAGSLPDAQSQDEVAMDLSLRAALAPAGSTLQLGDSLLLTTSSGEVSFRVVGFTAPGSVSASFTRDVIFVPQAELLRAFDLGLRAPLAALRLAPGASAGAVAAAVHSALGNSVAITGSAAETSNPLAQLTPLLLLVGVLSLLIGAGVSANTVSLAALERRRDIGLLRAAGASAMQVFRLLVGEATALALAGAALGVGAGVGLGALLQLAYRGPGSPPLPGLQISPWVAVLSALVGAAAAVAGAAVPAASSARLSILDALSADSAGRPDRLHGAPLGAVLPLLGLAVIAGLGGGAAVAVSAVAFLLAVGLSLPALAPWLTQWLGRLLGALWPETQVTAASLARHRNRTALTLSGLVTAVAAAVAGTILLSGSLAAGTAWVNSLFIGNTLVQSPVTERTAIATQLGQEAGVQVTGLRFFPAVVGGEVIGISAIDSRTYADHGGLDVVDGNRGQALAAIGAGPSLLAPLTLASANGWRVGTELAVETASGTTEFTVAGIVEHSFPSGDGQESLIVDGTEAVRTFGTDASGFDDLEVLTPGHTALVHRVATEFGLATTPITTIDARTEEALGDTVGILPAVAWIAVAIAMLAVVNTLVVNARLGRRELALLRAVGLSRGQARRLVLAQAALLGAAAVLAGLGVGCLLALPMLHASGSTGFQPAFVLPWQAVLVLAATVLVAPVVAALLPARRATAADIATAVHHE
ncbi:MAG: ABC transporter permease [Candidatus Dormibacteria bacterium]